MRAERTRADANPSHLVAPIPSPPLNRPAAEGSLLGAVLRQGVPLAFGMASHAMFNLVDLALVGRLGGDAVAGAHVATTVNFLLMILGNGVSVATMSLMSRHIGAGRIEEARALSSRSQVWMVLLGLVVGAVGALLAQPSVAMQGVSGEAFRIGVQYLIVSQATTFTMYLVMQTTATMRALGEAAMPVAILVGANVLNLLLDVVLLFGWDAVGIPSFGAVGVVWASAISRLVGGLIGLWWISRRGYPLRFHFVSLRGPLRELKQIVHIGLPQSTQMLVRALAVIALTRIAAELGGRDAVVALGVTTRLDTLVLFSAIGFASVATTLVGQNAGAGRPDRARIAARWSGIAAALFGSALVAVFAIFARPLMALFVENADAGVLDAGALYLRIAALGHPLAAFCIAVTGGVNGRGKVWPPMILDLAGYLGLLLPAAVVVAAMLPGARLSWIWWVFVGANVAIAFGYWVYLERSSWREAH